MIKLLHAADLHLGSPFRGLPPEKAASRRSEQRRLPELLADLYHDQGCDGMLLSGDLFDGAAAREDMEALTQMDLDAPHQCSHDHSGCGGHHHG